ncbi:MAG: zinc ribbon domain-containing protein [Spirochaetia bacterium]|nr:zinc ribbon domain-containing protein [Spirochaetia bacterium]
MPKYTYQCAACGVFEDEHSIKQDAHKICPKCGGREIKRLIGNNTAFILKGSGFYETDYKRSAGSDYASKANSESGPCSSCDKGKSGKCNG